MNLILADKAHIAQAVKATVIPLDDAPRAYREFDGGAAKKFVIEVMGTERWLRGSIAQGPFHRGSAPLFKA
jgi:hypothetical protein